MTTRKIRKLIEYNFNEINIKVKFSFPFHLFVCIINFICSIWYSMYYSNVIQ